MNVKEYIESGVIEDYCLGVLSPQQMESVAQNALLYNEVKHEIDAYEAVLIKYSASLGREGHAAAKRNLIGLLDNLESEENINADNLPVINKYSDAENWRRFVKPLLPEELNTPCIVHDLRIENDIEQFVFWTTLDVPHETHGDELETILLLEGTCRCYIDDEVIEMEAGDFLSVPLHRQHNVEILNGPVLAIVQRVKVA